MVYTQCQPYQHLYPSANAPLTPIYFMKFSSHVVIDAVSLLLLTVFVQQSFFYLRMNSFLEDCILNLCCSPTHLQVLHVHSSLHNSAFLSPVRALRTSSSLQVFLNSNVQPDPQSGPPPPHTLVLPINAHMSLAALKNRQYIVKIIVKELQYCFVKTKTRTPPSCFSLICSFRSMNIILFY